MFRVLLRVLTALLFGAVMPSDVRYGFEPLERFLTVSVAVASAVSGAFCSRTGGGGGGGAGSFAFGGFAPMHILFSSKLLLDLFIVNVAQFADHILLAD